MTPSDKQPDNSAHGLAGQIAQAFILYIGHIDAAQIAAAQQPGEVQCVTFVGLDALG